MGELQASSHYSMPTLLSARNPLLKDVRKAIARGALTEDGLAVAESFHLLEEALGSDCEIPLCLRPNRFAARWRVMSAG